MSSAKTIRTWTRPFRRAIELFLLICIAFPSIADAQLDSELEPEIFDGAPRTVRLENRTPGQDGPLVFRVYTFDASGRPVRIEQGTDLMGTTLVVDVTCDESGRILTLDRSFRGRAVLRKEHAYDEAGRLTRVDSINSINEQFVDRVTHEYDDAGRLVTSTKQAHGRPDEVTTRSYDAEGRLAGERVLLGDRELRRRVLSYDDRGCLKEDVTTLANGKTSQTSYEYAEGCRQKIRRLRSFANRQSQVRTSYDDEGRRILEETLRDGVVVNRLTWAYTFEDASEKPVEVPASVPSSKPIAD